MCCHSNVKNKYAAPVGQGPHGGHAVHAPNPVTTTPSTPATGQLWDKYGSHGFIYNLDHLREEASILLYMKDANQITHEESYLYFIKLHDFNSDGKLDGLDYVDSMLTAMDLNNDGFVDYGEIYTAME
ncbi:unnamed protein product [Medioppia subpectinata]|uniref:EF-hand domain-containing protein n=1 Tax=Medioppia subpectinata TaxID=1979941 RepID=A0A7R9PZT3_9ACAR|nr:unnamed protein product [Medioppia subpectinata]CAG2107318.1 unnamed protein product [Medioppia subpectinata]